MQDQTILPQKTARALLGWGMKTTSTVGGLAQAQDITFQDGDLALLSGLEMIEQDLSAAFTTSMGADPLNTNFGFDGFAVIAEESDKFILRERLRISVINLLRRGPRIGKIDQVMIGQERQDAGIRAEPDPTGTLGIHAIFRLEGRSERINIKIGSILGGGEP